MSKKDFTDTYLDEIKESTAYFEKRAEKLTKKLKTTNNKKSIEGMIVTTHDRLKKYADFCNHGFIGNNVDRRKEIISFLMEKGFKNTHNSYRTPQEPEFEYDGDHRHLRVRVNEYGIIILIDPHCTLQITRGQEFYMPNQRRLDFVWSKYENMVKIITWFMKRATDKSEDEHYLQEFGELVIH